MTKATAERSRYGFNMTLSSVQVSGNGIWYLSDFYSTAL